MKYKLCICAFLFIFGLPGIIYAEDDDLFQNSEDTYSGDSYQDTGENNSEAVDLAENETVETNIVIKKESELIQETAESIITEHRLINSLPSITDAGQLITLYQDYCRKGFYFAGTSMIDLVLKRSTGSQVRLAGDRALYETSKIMWGGGYQALNDSVIKSLAWQYYQDVQGWKSNEEEFLQSSANNLKLHLSLFIQNKGDFWQLKYGTPVKMKPLLQEVETLRYKLMYRRQRKALNEFVEIFNTLLQQLKEREMTRYLDARLIPVSQPNLDLAIDYYYIRIPDDLARIFGVDDVPTKRSALLNTIFARKPFSRDYQPDLQLYQNKLIATLETEKQLLAKEYADILGNFDKTKNEITKIRAEYKQAKDANDRQLSGVTDLEKNTSETEAADSTTVENVNSEIPEYNETFLEEVIDRLQNELVNLRKYRQELPDEASQIWELKQYQSYQLNFEKEYLNNQIELVDWQKVLAVFQHKNLFPDNPKSRRGYPESNSESEKADYILDANETEFKKIKQLTTLSTFDPYNADDYVINFAIDGHPALPRELHTWFALDGEHFVLAPIAQLGDSFMTNFIDSIAQASSNMIAVERLYQKLKSDVEDQRATIERAKIRLQNQIKLTGYEPYDIKINQQRNQVWVDLAGVLIRNEANLRKLKAERDWTIFENQSTLKGLQMMFGEWEVVANERGKMQYSVTKLNKFIEDWRGKRYQEFTDFVSQTILFDQEATKLRSDIARLIAMYYPEGALSDSTKEDIRYITGRLFRQHFNSFNSLIVQKMAQYDNDRGRWFVKSRADNPNYRWNDVDSQLALNYLSTLEDKIVDLKSYVSDLELEYMSSEIKFAGEFEKDDYNRWREERDNELEQLWGLFGMGITANSSAPTLSCQAEVRKLNLLAEAWGDDYNQLLRIEDYFTTAYQQNYIGFAERIYLLVLAQLEKHQRDYQEIVSRIEAYSIITDRNQLRKSAEPLNKYVDLEMMIKADMSDLLEMRVSNVGNINYRTGPLVINENIEDLLAGLTDADTDGVSDVAELEAGTDPGDSTSRP